tara:strand:+ start:999 stop:1457 length:459 start_codon:yes stop_codon:yes gene_type:complete
MANLPKMIIKGVGQWACVHEINDMSKKYQIDICQLGKKDIEALEKAGVEVKEGTGDKESKGRYVIAKTIRAPKVIDSSKQVWPPKIKIGNGSTVKCSVHPFDWVYKGKSGRSLSLNTVMVVDFQDYVGDDDLEEEDGYVLNNLDINDTVEDL